MTTKEDVYLKAGEALNLAQTLELALTLPIMMLCLLETGHCQENLTKQDILRMIKEDKTRARPTLKVKLVDEKLRERLRTELVNIAMLVQNGTMGKLKARLQHYIRISPGGPSASLTVLQEALEARNYLCHEFFKDRGTDLEKGQARDHAISKLDEMQDDFRAAIFFCDQLTAALRKKFPKTFDNEPNHIH